MLFIILICECCRNQNRAQLWCGKVSFSNDPFLQEVDLLLNDGSKHINVAGWRKSATLPQRVETSRRRSRRCLLMSLALAKTSVQQVRPLSFLYIIVLVGSRVFPSLFLGHAGHMDPLTFLLIFFQAEHQIK